MRAAVFLGLLAVASAIMDPVMDDAADAFEGDDLLYLDSVSAASVPSWYTDRDAETKRVRAYARRGREAISKAEAVGVSLDRLIRGTVKAADRRVQDFRSQVQAASVSGSNAALFERIAADAERASGSIVELGQRQRVVGLGKDDPKKTWDIFREINDEVNRQSRRQIFNAGVQYVQSYGHPQERYPVALIPGFGGTRLQAKLRDSKSGNPCDMDPAAYRDLWLSSKTLFRFLSQARTHNCVYDVLSLLWNGKDFTQRRKYQVRAVRGTRGVDLLDRGVSSSLSEYYKPLLVALETIGYNRDSTVRAFGYDWRYRPDRPKMAKSFARWKKRFEKMRLEYGKPAVVVAHAMGAQHFVYFLQHVIGKDPAASQTWIDNHIRSFVSIGGSHGGSPRVIKSLISGTSLSLPFMSKSKAGRMLGSFGTSAWMLPTEETFGDDPLLTIIERDGRKRPFSARRMSRLLEEAYLKPTVFHYNRVAPFTTAPGKIVNDAHFLFGTDVRTPVGYVYERGTRRLAHVATKTTDKGDGMVPDRSATHLCRAWRDTHCQSFPGVNHRELLWHMPLLTQVLEVATGVRTAVGGLVQPNANPLDAVDADGTKAMEPGSDAAMDLGAPSDVDGTGIVVDHVPGGAKSSADSAQPFVPLFPSAA
eukprot:TRINITY_DN406_c1_g2_i1.p1 TRINITY_DN406_c1_g2~~TRINITY_DN406_c1_g2_i1.p1  ORF type:complete len:673 (+),score=371.18 TRINITY_DN406_c1_g2_i1:79-2019(+)